MDSHKFKIVMTGAGRGKVFIDGQEAKGVSRVLFKTEAGKMNTVTVTYMTREIEIEDAVVIQVK